VLLLAFDTATAAVTVALHDGAAVVAAESAIDARRHGELLAVFIDKVLRNVGAGRADLTAVAVGTGPGPYTGLRAGLVTAKVLGSALQIRTDGFCSLDVIAAEAATAATTGAIATTRATTTRATMTGTATPAAGRVGSEFLVATDARRREVYWARYSRAGERTEGPLVGRPADLPAGLPVAGEGPALYPELAVQPLAPAYPSAACLAAMAVARIAAGEAPRSPEPLYLRRPDAREPGKPKRVTP
jgi:tRNA threonylcarbamoyl adenosine modification protein YeaZ